MRVITFGTFDVFHYGHLRLLQRARDLGDYLIVGVSTDALNLRKKRRSPVFVQEHRASIISALRCVDEVFFEESLEKKADYIEKYRADILVMGSDWDGKFDELREICTVHYLDRTPSISTTETIESIRS